MTWEPAPPPPAPCPYCAHPVEMIENSSRLYRNGRNYGPRWVCTFCSSHVGVHEGTTTPLGRLADPELRKLKSEVHALFDPLWRAKEAKGFSKKQARGHAYAWLAVQLDIDSAHCHVGMFDAEMCRRAIAVLEPHRERLRRRAS